MKRFLNLTCLGLLIASTALFTTCGGDGGGGSLEKVSTPVISPAGGDFDDWIIVQAEISVSTEGAAIYYTIDGSDPDESSTLYSGSIDLASSCTLKARAFLDGMNPSVVAENEFSILSYGWTKTAGGTGFEGGNSAAVDSSDNVYVAGYFQGTDADFDPGTGEDLHSSNGSGDIYVTKYNADGSYGWTKTAGGTSNDEASSVAVDSSGNVYVTGFFQGTDVDFDPGTGEDLHSSSGSADIFITKYNADGSYGWTKTIGGTDEDMGISVSVDSSGNVYVTGSFRGTDVDFDPGTGEDLHSSSGNRDIYVTKLNADGSYGWTKTIGGTSSDYGYSVAVDSSGNVYVSGVFDSTDVDFDPGTGEDFHSSNGNSNIFITKLHADGSYGWTKTMGGTGDDIPFSIAVDSSGNVYVSGFFQGTDVDFDPGTGEDLHSSNGSYDIFVTKLHADGSYGWTKTTGGTGSDHAYSIALDSMDNVYVTGSFEGTDIDFDPGTGEDLHSSNGINDIFVTKLHADGSYGWTKTMGGTYSDNAFSIAPDSMDNVYVTGYFMGTDIDFDPGTGEDLHSSSGGFDIFLMKYSR